MLPSSVFSPLLLDPSQQEYRRAHSVGVLYEYELVLRF
jgi:hypothetical protein